MPLVILAASLAIPGSLPAQPDAPLGNARNLLVQHRNADAEAVIRNYLRDNPDSADAHFLLAYTLFCEMKAADSLQEYTAAAKYRAPGPNDLMAIAADYVLLNDNEDADLLFMKVVKLEPGNELAWYYLGRARFYENHYEDAIKIFKQCLQLKPHDVPAETNMGLALRELGRDQEAIAAFQQAIEWDEQSNNHDGQPYLDLGLILRKDRHVDQSLPYLEKAEELESNNPETHFELAKTYEDLHRFKDAEAQLRLVLTIAPEAAAVHYILGRVLKAEGRSDEASQEFAATSRLNGTHSTKDVNNFNFPESPSISAGPPTKHD